MVRIGDAALMGQRLCLVAGKVADKQQEPTDVNDSDTAAPSRAVPYH